MYCVCSLNRKIIIFRFNTILVNCVPTNQKIWIEKLKKKKQRERIRRIPRVVMKRLESSAKNTSLPLLCWCGYEAAQKHLRSHSHLREDDSSNNNLKFWAPPTQMGWSAGRRTRRMNGMKNTLRNIFYVIIMITI